jgi:NAD(P)-dependent dehydrogenase (short-subunit alcohol dehydrogenase family)
VDQGKGRVVVVTGGTFGIGQAMTVLLAERGWKVAACGLDSPQPGSVAEKGSVATRALLEEKGLSAGIYECDVSSSAGVDDFVAQVVREHGAIYALVNNAAIHPRGDIFATSEEMFDRVIDVNLKGMFLVSKAVLPHMLAQKRGVIVNVGSGSGWGKADLLAYCASKGGVFGLTMALAYDLLHRNVRVNCLVPGGTVTGMTTGAHSSPNFANAALKTVTGRHNLPEDMAKACAFLLSDDAEQISGAFLDVGGFALQGGPVPGRQHG